MRAITTTFFSTLDREQTIDCLKFLLLPWKWKDLKNGKYIKEAEKLLADYLEIYPHCQSGVKGCENLAKSIIPPLTPARLNSRSGWSTYKGMGMKNKIYNFYNGRAALYYALKTAGVKEGDEVIIQSYTCITVPNAIIEAGAKPIYCDIDETLNLNPDDLKKKITNKTKAVIIQHSFGTPAKIDEIREICENYCQQSRASADKSISHNTCLRKIPPTPPLQKGGTTTPYPPTPPLQKGGTNAPIILIEDCAHSLGAKYKGRPAGSFGDISMFSFGRDKVISSVNGGMMYINNKNLKIPILAKEELGEVKAPPYLLIIRNLFYPILAEISLKWYNKLSIGKIIMYASKKLRLFPLILSKEEKSPLLNKQPKKPNLSSRPTPSDPALAGEQRGSGGLPACGVRAGISFAKINSSFLKRIPSRKAGLGMTLFRRPRRPTHYRMPNVLAYLFIKQFKKLDEYNEHRRKIAEFYNAELPPHRMRYIEASPSQCHPIFLRYTIFTEKADELIKAAKKHDIYLGDWYRTVIAPKDINLASIGYEQNMCPKAERYAKLTVNLPNHPGITVEDAGRMVEVIKNLELRIKGLSPNAPNCHCEDPALDAGDEAVS